MVFWIQLASYVLWFPLKALGISALLRVGVRRYPLVFLYMVVSFLLVAVQTPFAFSFHRGNRQLGEFYQTLNSVGNISTYLLILAVVVSFIYGATARSRIRRLILTTVLSGAVLLVLVSFLVHHRAGAPLGVWMSYWTRDVHFGAAVLDLGAWGMLVAARDRDTRLLLLTGGMGIMFAGEAVGAALQSIAIPHRSAMIFYTGHYLKVLADLAFLYVWWQTFRNEAKARERGAGLVAANGR